jgi:hypothetical protein
MSLSAGRFYRQNRSRFSPEELRRYDGRWVAFSADGQRIVASDESLAALATQVRANGVDMRNVVVERIKIDDREIYLGGAELS